MSAPKRWRVAGINFDHFHMGDLLRMVADHPQAEIVAICDHDPARMRPATAQFGLSPDRVFTDLDACLETSKPDLVILCPAAAGHGDWTERVAAHRLPVLIEKPFAASLAEADRMVRAMERAGQPLAINWPLRWVASHATTHRVLTESLIGEVREVHYYDGNRGPLYHGADKIEREPTIEEKASSWFYRRARGGGSLLDYLGYGTTLGTWFLGGRKPTEVMCLTDETPGLEVDQHSVTIARYPCGLSKFETRWGTFTDPWTHQPQPRCGFVIVGSEGTIGSWDYAAALRVQTRRQPEGFDLPVDALAPPFRNPIEYFIHCLEAGTAVEGPLSPVVSRIGQQIVDTARRSAQEKRALPLIE